MKLLSPGCHKTSHVANIHYLSKRGKQDQQTQCRRIRCPEQTNGFAFLGFARNRFVSCCLIPARTWPIRFSGGLGTGPSCHVAHVLLKSFHLLSLNLWQACLIRFFLLDLFFGSPALTKACHKDGLAAGPRSPLQSCGEFAPGCHSRHGLT